MRAQIGDAHVEPMHVAEPLEAAPPQRLEEFGAFGLQNPEADEMMQLGAGVVQPEGFPIDEDEAAGRSVSGRQADVVQMQVVMAWNPRQFAILDGESLPASVAHACR